jgi:hypothetical protein
MRPAIAVLALSLLPLHYGCRHKAELPAVPADVAIVSEQPVIEIPLNGPVSEANAEVSGITWYGDWLILLPQYPSVLGGSVYALAKADIIAFLDGEKEGPLTPRAIASNATDLEDLPDYEGLEAIVFEGRRVYVTIEADRGSEMVAYLVAGKIEPDLSTLTLDTSKVVTIPAQTGVDNYSEESLLLFDDMVVTLYEANGRQLNESPMVHMFDRELNNLGTVSFPHVEYRITDATMPDAEGRFWVINYVFEGSIGKLDPAPDPLVAHYGVGETHAKQNTVERLLEFQYSAAGVTLTDRPPLQLTLRSDEKGRNWEGVARLDERGFLLVTDKFPDTILGFVEMPQ